MARIAGVDLPNEKRIEAGLTYIYLRKKPVKSERSSNPITWWKAI